MSQSYPTPQPLFETLENIHDSPECVFTYLESLNIPAAKNEFQLCVEFLKSYANSKDTFISYRRESERLLHWSWLICKKPLKEITRNDIRDYLQFIVTPSKTWMGIKIVNRFVLDAKGYIQRQQTRKVTRKLSRLQWNYVITTCEEMAKSNPQHQRTLFLMSAFYLLGLRISELAYGTTRQATMGNFAPDKRGLWWYTTVGQGNKVRDVAVPDELLALLKRYRETLGLSPFISTIKTFKSRFEGRN